ncbi:CPBP family intramembrane metalloprotease [Candidatus Contubernalis alkalaceticus]|nr:CPBP family intramembrane metalloprotease [Candidatus Contubernalis alkalaceticus]
MKGNFLRPLWEKVFKSEIRFIVVMFVLLGIIRIIGLVREEINVVVLGFLIMWVLPVVFFHKNGRGKIGIKKADNRVWLLLSFFIGVLGAGVIYWLGHLLYGTGTENWGMTVVREYSAQGEALTPGVFVVITFLSMLFSPIGEELFFRGMIHEVLAKRLSSYKWAGFLSSISFAAIHIPHYDLIFAGRGFTNTFVPMSLWFLFMFLVSYLFIYARSKSGSIFGAILCHSGYILGMNSYIYFALLSRM